MERDFFFIKNIWDLLSNKNLDKFKDSSTSTVGSQVTTKLLKWKWNLLAGEVYHNPTNFAKMEAKLSVSVCMVLQLTFKTNFTLNCNKHPHPIFCCYLLKTNMFTSHHCWLGKIGFRPKLRRLSLHTYPDSAFVICHSVPVSIYFTSAPIYTVLLHT